jgi:hypothetical protein
VIPSETQTYTIRVTYSGGETMISEGWTLGKIEQLRASWAQIEGPSTATAEILHEDPA